jgi:hypothetical protein
MELEFRALALNLLHKLEDQLTTSTTKLNQKIQRNLLGYLASKIYFNSQES